MALAVLDVEVPFLQLSNSLQKEQRGIKNVSVATNAIAHLTQCWHVMVPIRKYTAVHAMVVCLVLKALDMVTLQHYPLTESLP